MNLFYNCKD